jgi:hypothetical protein
MRDMDILDMYAYLIGMAARWIVGFALAVCLVGPS